MNPDVRYRIKLMGAFPHVVPNLPTAQFPTMRAAIQHAMAAVVSSAMKKDDLHGYTRFTVHLVDERGGYGPQVHAWTAGE